MCGCVCVCMCGCVCVSVSVSVCIIKTVKALELTLGKLHVLMYPSHRKILSCFSSFYFNFCFLFFI